MMPRRSCCIAVLLVLSTFPLRTLSATDLNPNDILVSGSNSVTEYTPQGTVVQTFPFNYNGGSYPGAEHLRDIVVDPASLIQGYNGTFSPLLTSVSPITGAFTHTPFSGWSTINNVSYGGIGAFQSFVFATDMNTSGAAANGIVRFDTSSQSATRFANGIDFIDLNIGLDGEVYGLYDAGGAFINVYDPLTLALVRVITLPSIVRFNDLRAVAVDQLGRLFIADWSSRVYRLSSKGDVEVTNVTSFGNLTDIDIDQAGRVILGQRFGEVIVGDSALSSFTSFSAGGSPVFVSFAKPVPEPSAVFLLISAAVIAVSRRNKR